MPPTEVPAWRRLGLSLRRLEPARDSSPNPNAAGERSSATNSDSTPRPRRSIKRVSSFQKDPSHNSEPGDSEKENHSFQVAFRSIKPARTSKTKPGLGIDQSLPPLASIEDIFADMASNALQLGLDAALKDLRGRMINIATMCSGTESPLIALQLLSKALEEDGEVPFRINHVFSAEIDPVKQGYIERNFQPNILFRDVREFIPDNAETATTAYGAQVSIPDQIDLLIAGFVCKDLSRLNSHPKGLEDEGESGDTWLAIYSYTRRFRPSIVLIENVQNTIEFWNSFESKWTDIGYESSWLYRDTKNFYLPQTRKRMYMIAINKDLYGQNVDEAVESWKRTMHNLQRQCSSPFDAFLTENFFDRPTYGSSSNEVDWSLCRLRNDQIRSDKMLGLRRPISQWSESGTVKPPDNADIGWYQSQSTRVYDAIDIAHLQAALSGYVLLWI